MPVLFPDAIQRPTRNTPAVREKAMAEFWPEVLKWLDPIGPGEDEKRMRLHLEDALDSDPDGYDAAQTLDRHGWSPDAELVELLDGWSWYVNEAEDAAVMAWVKECGIAPKHKVGDAVRARWSGGEITGTITRIDDKQATYTVTREGDEAGYGPIVNYENVIEPEVANVDPR